MEETRMEQDKTAASFEALLRDNREYQSAFDKKVDKALQTARANWEREQAAALESQRAQALSDARDSAEAEYRERLAALEAREGDFARRSRQVAVAERLTGLGLSAAFAPWLTGETEEECEERVDAFHAAFTAAVGEEITGRMAGLPPTEPVPTPAFDRESLRGMSPREINAHWAEIQHTLKG